MSIDTFIAVLTPVVLIVGIGIYLYRSNPKVRSTIDDLRDDGRLNDSNVDHPATITAALQGAAEVVRASQPAVPVVNPLIVTSSDQVHDQATLDKYRAYLSITNPGLLAYTPTIYVVPAATAPAGDPYPLVIPTAAGDHYMGPALTRGANIKVQSVSGRVIAFPIPADATKFSIAPIGGGYGATFNAWASMNPAEGDSSLVLGEVSSIGFVAGHRYANLRALGPNDPVFVQVN